MAKILVIEDELKILQIIEAYLKKEGFHVYTAIDGRQGLDLAKNLNPDLIILDLMLPGLSGEQLLTEVRQISDVSVIILSAKTSEDERIFGLNIGADDYLSKPFSPRELVARVQAQLRRRNVSPINATTAILTYSFNQGTLLIDPNKYEVYRNQKQIYLTPTEFKILLLLSQSSGQVFSRGQLLERIQGNSFEGYERTIDSHIKNLRQKIEDNTERPQYILTVFGVGYKFGGTRD
ncbi:MAG: response regulator transcription factor [Firmicutes bacterium]|nr:response regulator transcription factor [Bacillota bacterium]